MSEYQKRASETAIYPGVGSMKMTALNYVVVGLAGEAGEALNKYKKVLRDGGSPEKLAAIDDEVGDILWYMAQYATERGLTLQYLADLNLDKLADRAERGVVGGSGDVR